MQKIIQYQNKNKKEKNQGKINNKKKKKIHKNRGLYLQNINLYTLMLSLFCYVLSNCVNNILVHNAFLKLNFVRRTLLDH